MSTLTPQQQQMQQIQRELHLVKSAGFDLHVELKQTRESYNEMMQFIGEIGVAAGFDVNKKINLTELLEVIRKKFTP